MPIAYLDYAGLQDRVEQFLQDTSNAIYDTTELGMWIEEGLKEFSNIVPHIITVIFKIESRFGSDLTGTASSLTDTAKSQFLDTDDDNEKVVHNTTDNTWAVVKTASASTSVLTLTADIMDANEQYEIYNKRCWNEKQIYIGDMAPFIGVVSVEYPLGTRRDFKVLDDKIEIDVSMVQDSDSTLSPPRDVDAYVTFALPHRLCQLTDLDGTATAVEPVGETSLAIENLTGTEIIEIGDELHIANQRTTYFVTLGGALTGGARSVTVYPEMEAATVIGDAITFRKSTLKPQHENILFKWICGIALQSESFNKIQTITPGGQAVYERFESKGLRLVAEAKDEAMKDYDVDLWAATTYSRGRQISEL